MGLLKKDKNNEKVNKKIPANVVISDAGASILAEKLLKKIKKGNTGK